MVENDSVERALDGSGLVISCLGDDTGGGLCSFDGKQLEVIDRISTTGLYFDGQCLYRLLWAPEDFPDSASELLVYDARGVRKYYRLDGVLGPHDVLVDGEHVIVVSTGNNRVLWYSMSGEVVRTWQAPGEGDSWHLNSLLELNGDIYVSAFGDFARHRDWKSNLSQGTGFVMSLSNGARLFDGLFAPHHPRRIGDAFYVCNSAKGELVELDADSRSIRRGVQLMGWTRGLAGCGELLFVGESRHREGPLASGTATVAVLDRRSLRVLGRISVPNREIYDIVVVPHALIEGLRRGFRTNAFRAAEEQQRNLFDAVGVSPTRFWAVGEALPAEACRVCVSAEVPRVLTAGDTISIECSVEHRGTAVYVSAPPYPVRLAYRWFRLVHRTAEHRTTGGDCQDSPGSVTAETSDGEWPPSTLVMEGERVYLPHPLTPGEVVLMKCLVRVPKQPGEYVLRVTLVQEFVAWFDDLDPSNGVRSHVTVVEPTATMA